MSVPAMIDPEIGGAQEVYGYLTAGGQPVVLVSAGLSGAGQRAELHRKRFFHFDPAAAPFARTSFARRVQSTEIAQKEYRERCYDSAGIREKLSFGWRRGAGAIVLNFYLGSQSSAPLRARLASLANLGLAALVEHARAIGAPTSPLSARISRRLRLAAPELPRRELQVCALTLAGCSASEIAIQLGISASTALTYRQRAYRRLGVNRATELLAFLL